LDISSSLYTCVNLDISEYVCIMHACIGIGSTLSCYRLYILVVGLGGRVRILSVSLARVPTFNLCGVICFMHRAGAICSYPS